MTQEEIDRIAGDLAEARAAVGMATAQHANWPDRTANSPRSRPRSPAAWASAMIDPSNLVKANETILATLVSLDPIYASFDLDEQTFLRLRRLIREDGKIVSARTSRSKSRSGSPTRRGIRSPGSSTFIDNSVDPGTGTQRVWATVRQLQAPPFARACSSASGCPVGKPKPSLLVPEEALGSDQGQRYVFVLNDKDEVVYRPVKLGPQVDRLRVIEDGMHAGRPGDRQRPAAQSGRGVKVRAEGRGRGQAGQR